MTSVLIFVKPDNDHDDPEQDWKKFKAGDVIDMQNKNNFKWGAAIQGPNALGWWRVVTVNGATKAELAHLLDSGPMPFVSVAPMDPSTVKHQKRTQAMNIDLLKDVMSRDEFFAAIVRKPEIMNKNVIG